MKAARLYGPNDLRVEEMPVPEAAARWVCLGRRFDPDSSLAAPYRQRLARYEDLLDRLYGWSGASLVQKIS